MEDWLSELFFPPAETEQQKYERKVAAARAAQERRRDPPRNELDRAGRAIGQFFETPAPPWYDNPEVFRGPWRYVQGPPRAFDGRACAGTWIMARPGL